MRRRVVGVVVALVLGAVGTVALVAFVSGAEERALAGERLVDVFVVEKAIPAGTAARNVADHVRAEAVPTKVRAEDAVTTLDELGDRVSTVELVPGEQLTLARFEEPDVFARRRAQIEVPDDKLEVTVSLEPERAAGGVLRPGSRVAVLASFDPFDLSSTAPVELDGLTVPEDGKTPNSTHVILHKVLVTNVQTDTSFDPGETAGDSATAPAPGGNLLITLAVSAPEVEQVVFAAEHGEVWLAIDPEAAPTEGTRVQTRGTIYR